MIKREASIKLFKIKAAADMSSNCSQKELRQTNKAAVSLTNLTRVILKVIRGLGCDVRPQIEDWVSYMKYIYIYIGNI